MRTRMFAVMVIGSLFVGRAFAEPPTSPDGSALKGPSISDHSGRKGKGTFGPDAIEKKNAGNKSAPALSMPEFLKALDVLRASPTPEGARLTADQDTKIKAVAAEFDSTTKAYMDKSKAELDALRAKLSPNDRNMLDQQLARGGQIRLSKAGFGGKKSVLKNKDKGTTDTTPTTGDTGQTATPSRDEVAKTRSRIVEIYAGRPKVEEVQAKILGMLSPEQLPLANAELAKLDAKRTPGHAPKGAGKGQRRQQPTAPKPA